MSEFSSTIFAFVSADRGMDYGMSLEQSLLAEGFVAQIIMKLSILMCSDVSFQVLWVLVVVGAFAMEALI